VGDGDYGEEVALEKGASRILVPVLGWPVPVLGFRLRRFLSNWELAA